MVATPLGNRRDITLRALDILGSADIVAAEDTRVTTPLLRHFGIATRPVSVREHNESARAGEIIAALREGRSVALVSDAGTPAVSDPGARLVRAVRAAGLAIVPVPGPSATIAAISAAGLGAEGFIFLGFLPKTPKARREALASVASLGHALVIFEAPHRVCATICELAAALGGEREIVIARELTKRFETIARMRLGEALDWFAADSNRERGEFVLVIDAPEGAANRGTTSSAEVERWLRALLGELPPSRAARVVAAVTGQSRDDVYARALALKSADG